MLSATFSIVRLAEVVNPLCLAAWLSLLPIEQRNQEGQRRRYHASMRDKQILVTLSPLNEAEVLAA